MKKYILNYIIENISKYQEYSDVELKRIRYGLETVYLTIFKTVLFIVLSIIFGYFHELIMYMIFYGILRLFGFGAHAKESIHCWIGSTFFFITFPLISKYLIINKIVNILISLIAFIILCIYAPSDTEKRPLINKNKRKRYKILTIVVSLIYLFLIYKLETKGFINVLMLSMVTEAFMISPLCYKLLGVPYKNYMNHPSYRKE